MTENVRKNTGMETSNLGSLPNITKQKKIALFGSTGMAGSAINFYLQSVGFNVQSYPRKVFDILASSVGDLNLAGIDLVINAAGLINRRENNLEFLSQVRVVNTDFPLALASFCERKKIPMIHISTDCVFDGQLGEYTETDEVSVKDVYGESKYLGEPENAMVLRLSMVGPEQVNFYSLLCWFLSQKYECPGYTNHHWNGLTTIQLAKVIGDIVEKDLFQNGLFHTYSTDITKHHLLELFKTHFQKEIEIHPVTATHARDMRLRTHHSFFLDSLNIPCLDNQIKQMVRYCDHLGHWSH
tara:strand:+ start:442 stop:1335 length:894 start_codon:yes stop_codon:yes gene_type:complete